VSPVVPLWVEVIVAALVVASALCCLAAAYGLARLKDFFQRLHPPALASTVGVWSMALASGIYLSAHSGEVALQVWIVAVVMSITAPVTTTLLARAALFRLRAQGKTAPAPLGPREDP
jgi:multicomponent K+:H+ antiporter subunit G